MKIGIAVSKVRLAIAGKEIPEQERERLNLELDKCRGNTVQLDVSELDQAVIDALMRDDLSMSQRRVLSLFKLGASDDSKKVLDAVIATPAEFHNAIAALTTGNEPSAEVMINGRWYPIILNSALQKDSHGSKYCVLSTQYKMCDLQHGFAIFVNENMFLDDHDHELTYTVTELLHKLNLRPLQSDLREHFDLLRLADRFQSRNGETLWATGHAVMVENRSWWRGVDVVELGSPKSPGQIVVESEMEKEQQYQYYGSSANIEWRLPYVRVFSLDKKRYAYVDVRDLAEREWDDNALDRLILPEKLSSVLRKVFDAPTDQLFGDIVTGKAGGMIVLAEGGPGVGKTMTAEVFAEHTHRPLYVLEMAELGTNLASVEDNLRKIFRRAARWNAVLLFDEADVFMSKRGHNLEQSAIVGVFLRLLDYYKGMLFLTSNRSDVIDPAFKSRITLSLTYPDLDPDRRRLIWASMLDVAGVKLVDNDGSPADLNGVPDVELNGRQIRNMVRLIKVIHGPSVTPTQIKEICEFSCK